MLATDVLAFVRAALPPAPARVLEVGAGDGELAAALREAGYDVVAIDPAAEAPGVEPVALIDLDAPDGSFDAAVAVVSLHHVDPLEPSCRRLAALLRPGGALLVDELDCERYDERAARWWLDRRAEAGEDDDGEHAGHGHAAHEEHAEHGHAAHEEHAEHDRPATPAEMVADLRAHVHTLARVRAALAPHFAVGPPLRGAYLHRWYLPPGLRDAEEELIAAGELPPTGARLLGLRR